MDLKKLREMLKIVAESDVAEVEIDEDGTKVTIRRNAPSITVQPSGFYPPAGYYPPPAAGSHHPAPVPAPIEVRPAPEAPPEQRASPQAAPTNEITIRAPIVGTFYSSPSPDSPPFVAAGTRVGQGTVLCIIEAMKLMNEIECEVVGTIRQILVENGDPVEYDQPLFVIEADA